MRNLDRFLDLPDDPPTPPQVEEALEILEAAGVGGEVALKITDIIQTLCDQLAAECPNCVRRMNAELDAAAQEWQKEKEELPKSTLCPHGNEDCVTCDRVGDFAYDAEREKRYFMR